jgi:hypothetical protein
MPGVRFSAAGNNDLLEVDPCLADQFCAFIVIEDGDFQLIIVGRVVDGKAQFLFPVVY